MNHQKMIPSDARQSLDITEMFLARMDMNNFSLENFIGDENHFPVNGTVKKLNNIQWVLNWKNSIHEIPVYFPKITVLCSFTARFILDPSVFYWKLFLRLCIVLSSFKKITGLIANLRSTSTVEKTIIF